MHNNVPLQSILPSLGIDKSPSTSQHGNATSSSNTDCLVDPILAFVKAHRLQGDLDSLNILILIFALLVSVQLIVPGFSLVVLMEVVVFLFVIPFLIWSLELIPIPLDFALFLLIPIHL